ncbi:replication-relaxation family protein [Actinocrinis puniceicyclus]|uniref:Replication-relaxation family protein n=1 Tax=Actinocrinis puniceicyclus TaxID=977794 RepID=A0A8J8BFG9_9ACTN|nr:replication-relaxation family protein [Actinocrinis puniceicyclus]MBS2966640.1 replication-relaxation family protein [Actinocrinis puniceicyclus]
MSKSAPIAVSARRGSPFPHRGATLPYLLFRTTLRDRWLLAMLAEHRVLTAEQITALAYRTLRSANRRLAALADLKLVERFRAHPGQFGATPYHYVLGPAGALLVAAAHDLTPKAFGYDRSKLLRQAMRPDLGHTLGCNSLLIDLATEHRSRPERRLDIWWDQDSCTRVWGDVIRPDAYAVYTAPDTAGTPTTCGFFLEYDTGSESLTQLVAKMTGYARHLDVYGGNRPVLIHLPDQARELALHARLAATSNRPQIPVATTTAPRLAQPVWLPLGSRARLALPDLPSHFHSAGYRLLTPVHNDPDVRAPIPVPDTAWI